MGTITLEKGNVKVELTCNAEASRKIPEPTDTHVEFVKGDKIMTVKVVVHGKEYNFEPLRITE